MDEYRQATAYRKDLTDVIPGCFAVFYGVRRARMRFDLCYLISEGLTIGF